MGKKLGKLVAFTALAGIAVAAYEYYKQYSDFHKDLEEDFHDFEDENPDGGEATATGTAPSRNYVSLNADKDEFSVAAKDTWKAAKGMASSAVEMLKDVGAIVADNMKEGSAAAGDTASQAREKVNGKLSKVKTYVKDAAGKFKKGNAGEESAEEENSEEDDEPFESMNVDGEAAGEETDKAAETAEKEPAAEAVKEAAAEAGQAAAETEQTAAETECAAAEAENTAAETVAEVREAESDLTNAAEKSVTEAADAVKKSTKIEEEDF